MIQLQTRQQPNSHFPPQFKPTLRFGSTTAASPATPLAPILQTPETVRAMLKEFSYKDGYFFVLHGDTPANMSLQVQYMAPDVDVPGSKAELRTGARKWPILPHYKRGQILQTLLVALIAIEEHEVRENFRYQGKQIGNPHFIIDKLVTFVRQLANEGVKPPEAPLKNFDEAQAILSDASIMGYQFKLEQFSRVDVDKALMVVKIVDNPKKPVEKDPLNEVMDGKVITFVTTATKSKMLLNLLEELIKEQHKEIKYRLQDRGVAPFGNNLCVDDLSAFASDPANIG
ncbi:MAG: hypothetical protein K2X01_06625 [Cyanobacteria bacterium]|nr:hypothetical protein [Cyanobacteriota bacterium]